MHLKSFFSSVPPGERDAFAKRCGTSKGHLQNVMNGHAPLAPIVCVAVERESAGAVTRKELRPDDWQKIWPELAQTPATIEQPATDSVAQGVV
jgi:DNA-binding transcriptional regulator YdaS (Cro superfamily)